MRQQRVKYTGKLKNKEREADSKNIWIGRPNDTGEKGSWTTQNGETLLPTLSLWHTMMMMIMFFFISVVG